MARPYSMDLRERVLAAWENGEGSQAALARRFDLSEGTVSGWLQALRTTGRRTPKPPGRGPASLLTAEGEAVLRELVMQDNDGRLVDYQAGLKERLGISLSQPVICRTLQRLKLTRKKRPFGPANKTAMISSRNGRNTSRRLAP